jgi:hypothetical protein
MKKNGKQKLGIGSYLSYGGYLFGVLLLLLDSFGSDTKSARYLHLDSREVALVISGLLIIYRTRKEFGWRNWWARVSQKVAIISLTMGSGLSILGWMLPDNSVYTATRMQYQMIFLIGVMSLLVILLEKTNKIWKGNGVTLIFWFPAALMLILGVVRLWPFDMFLETVKEDHLIEWGQFGVLVLGIYWTAGWAIKCWQRERGYAAALAGITIVLFFLAGEEISWGQRIFKFRTPEVLVENNYQEEANIHNLNQVKDLVGTGYWILGWYGSGMWMVQKKIGLLKKKPWRMLIPSRALAGYFLVDLGLNYLTKFQIAGIGPWSEVGELLLYCGVVLTIKEKIDCWNDERQREYGRV